MVSTTRLTDDQLKIAHALEDWDALWLAAEPLVKFAMSELRCGDEDALQEARVAAGTAVRSWNPVKGAFSTHVTTYARQAILDWLRGEAGRGIGSRRQFAENVTPEMISLNDPAEAPSDEDDDRPTHLDRLTYADIDDSTEFEALMHSGQLQVWADQLLRFIPDEEAEFFRNVVRAGGVRPFARLAGLPVMTTQDLLVRVMGKLSVHRAKTCYNRGTGPTGQEQNGNFWRKHHVGNPWADWAYKPTAADLAAGASPRDGAFKWSLGALRMGAGRRKS